MTKTPHHKRMAISQRYWDDPAKRLASVNQKRGKIGLPLHDSVENIGAPKQRAESVTRASDGRFDNGRPRDAPQNGWRHALIACAEKAALRRDAALRLYAAVGDKHVVEERLGVPRRTLNRYLQGADDAQP